ncbi:hypothetical protein PgNI_06187, partial [Pyricularia grisea]|uniref:Uncharacterized protein n=1 Tax=Pyricularia grisea TaxID=148305 RepID=A0A6P8B5B7_PYRGI
PCYVAQVTDINYYYLGSLDLVQRGSSPPLLTMVAVLWLQIVLGRHFETWSKARKQRFSAPKIGKLFICLD